MIFFADKNVCSIALEVPNSVLEREKVGPWHRTLVGRSSEVGQQRGEFFTGRVNLDLYDDDRKENDPGQPGEVN